MGEYIFFPSANNELDKIWAYSEDTHGERQAEIYMIGLHTYLQKLSDKEVIWKSLPQKWVVPEDLDVQVYFNKYEYHFIYFREFLNKKIGIMSILHETMDIPVRLKKDLYKIK